MPAFAAHIIFGDEMVKKEVPETLQKVIKKNPGAFHAGCQGPDMFLYNLLLLFGPKDKNLGNLLHEENTSGFFEAFAVELAREKNPRVKNVGISYLMGFLTHYALDSTVHPYVYGKVGYKTDDPCAAGKTIGAHNRLESVMDRIILEKNNQLPSDFYPCQKIKMTRKEKQELAKIMAAAMCKIIPLRITPVNVLASYESMNYFASLMYEKRSFGKYKIPHWEAVILRHTPFPNLMVYNGLPDKVNAMNTPDEGWVHPWEKEKHGENVWDLFAMAKVNFRRYSQILSPVLTDVKQHITIKDVSENKIVIDEIKGAAQKLGNLSYHSGQSIDF